MYRQLDSEIYINSTALRTAKTRQSLTVLSAVEIKMVEPTEPSQPNMKRNNNNKIYILACIDLPRGPEFDTRSGNILSFLLPLFQEGQLSVTGESMCTKYWLTA